MSRDDCQCRCHEEYTCMNCLNKECGQLVSENAPAAVSASGVSVWAMGAGGAPKEKSAAYFLEIASIICSIVMLGIGVYFFEDEDYNTQKIGALLTVGSIFLPLLTMPLFAGVAKLVKATRFPNAVKKALTAVSYPIIGIGAGDLLSGNRPVQWDLLRNLLLVCRFDLGAGLFDYAYGSQA